MAGTLCGTRRVRSGTPPAPFFLPGLLLGLLLTAASFGDARAQGTGVSPAGSIGLALVDEQLGLALSVGPRVVAAPFVMTAVVDMTVVGAGDGGRYEWQIFGCKDTATDQDVDASRCGDPDVLWGGAVDGSVVLDAGSDVYPTLGAGFRVGTVSTFFGAVGLTGGIDSSRPWYLRILFSGRFLQLHFGIAPLPPW